MIRLICMDLDGVLVPKHNFWLELHKVYGTLEQGTALAKKHSADYATLVEEIMQLWTGKDAAPYFALVESYSYLPGMKTLFAELSRFADQEGTAVPRVIITGGCYDIALRIANEYGVDHIFANQIIVRDGKITGEYHWPVGAGGYTKRQIIEQLCDDFNILPQDVLMIGDSEGDIEAFRIAGRSIAFNCSSRELRKIATYAVDSGDLHELIPILAQIRENSTSMPAGSPKI